MSENAMQLIKKIVELRGKAQRNFCGNKGTYFDLSLVPSVLSLEGDHT